MCCVRVCMWRVCVCAQSHISFVRLCSRARHFTCNDSYFACHSRSRTEIITRISTANVMDLRRNSVAHWLEVFYNSRDIIISASRMLERLVHFFLLIPSIIANANCRVARLLTFFYLFTSHTGTPKLDGRRQSGAIELLPVCALLHFTRPLE